MSIVALAEGTESSITVDVLRDVTARSNINITSPSHTEAYLTVLQAADATAALVNDLPDYIDPRLLPVPTNEPRTFSKPDPRQNTQNAWSNLASLQASQPSSDVLKGKRVVIKDNLSVGDLPFTCGMFEHCHQEGKYPISPIDATAVRRILEAGAHVLGTVTCENYSMTPMSYSSANGPVDNPWLSGHSSGGSTSGGACLLGSKVARLAGVPGLPASGGRDDLIDIVQGGDQAGSIRLPASYCGVYGLKPTYGLIPYTGIVGLHPMIDHTGPLALTLDDIARALTATAGYDGLDARMTPETPLRSHVTAYHAELSSFSASRAPSEIGRGLRVGIITESLTGPGTSPEVAAIVKASAAQYFTAAGATVEEVSIPLHLLGPAIWTASTRNHMASLVVQGRVPDMLTHNLPHFKPKYPVDREMFELLSHHNPAVMNVLFGETLLTDKYGPEVQAKAHRHVFQLRATYDAALARYDVLITPTTPTVAPQQPDMRSEKEGGWTVMQKLRTAVGSTNHTCPFNVTGHPALSVPCGWGRSAGGKEGWLPVGMQIVGKSWDDLGVLKAARVWEAGGGGLGKWPGSV